MTDKPTHRPRQSNSPAVLDDDAVLARLFEIQVDVRELLREYQIKPTGFVGMARQARQAISSTETRADLLELLIELQEFGQAAKERGIIGEAAMTEAGILTTGASAATAKRRGTPATADTIDPRSTSLPEMNHNDDTKINKKASDDFFEGLNDGGHE